MRQPGEVGSLNERDRVAIIPSFPATSVLLKRRRAGDGRHHCLMAIVSVIKNRYQTPIQFFGWIVCVLPPHCSHIRMRAGYVGDLVLQIVDFVVILLATSALRGNASYRSI